MNFSTKKDKKYIIPLIEGELAIEAPEGMYKFSDNTIGNVLN